MISRFDPKMIKRLKHGGKISTQKSQVRPHVRNGAERRPVVSAPEYGHELVTYASKKSQAEIKDIEIRPLEIGKDDQVRSRQKISMSIVFFNYSHYFRLLSPMIRVWKIVRDVRLLRVPLYNLRAGNGPERS